MRGLQAAGNAAVPAGVIAGCPATAARDFRATIQALRAGGGSRGGFWGCERSGTAILAARGVADRSQQCVSCQGGGRWAMAGMTRVALAAPAHA